MLIAGPFPKNIKTVIQTEEVKTSIRTLIGTETDELKTKIKELEEQNRIVEKLNHFMNLFGQFEKKITERYETLLKLRESSHHELSDAKNDNSFQEIFDLITNS